MTNGKPYRIKSISAYHELRGLPQPEHPLISVVSVGNAKHSEDSSLVLDCYSISIKRGLKGKLKYGQQEYDFGSGVMFFISPNQVFNVEANDYSNQSGWVLLIHPDFLWNTTLAKTIKQFEFFKYSVNEALFLSEKDLGSLLRVLTGQSTQQHIHHKLIEKAKERLSTSDLSISEIAYELGFEHSQSFSKLFKAKTNLSPSAYRESFN